MVFDIPSWLADMAGCDRTAVVHRSEARPAQSVEVEYELCDSRSAKVLMRPAGQARRAANWEIVATLDGRAERIELPAGARVIWR
ncbi:MAG: hypothetical protein M3253_06095 [Chloroflexota bacterium]|nr:hypothetical protein [Chloroflexota bacterium]